MPTDFRLHTYTLDAYVGKVFYLELDGQGKVPVLHFGMTGMLQVRDLPSMPQGNRKGALLIDKLYMRPGQR